MKNLLTYCLLGVMGVMNLAFAQSPYKLEVEQEVVGTDLHMSLYITKLSGADFNLSSSNFAVIIDTANLDINNMTKIDEGIWDNGTDPQSYLDLFLGKGPNFLNLSTRRNTSGTGTGQLVTATKSLIGKISIPIKNQCATNTSEWVVLPAAQNKFPLTNIKADAQFVNPGADFPLCIAPDAPDLIYNGSDTICEGDVAQLSTTATGDLQWYLNGVELAGETGQTLDATQSGTYTVEAVNCICKTMSLNSRSLIVNPLPEIPVITQNANSLQIDPTDAQIFWYKDGELFASNTTMIDNLEDGTYTVMLKNDCGEKMSTPIQITTSSVSTELVGGLTAYPNPFKGTSQIKLVLVENNDVSLIAYNVLGEQVKVLMDGNRSAGEYLVDFSTEESLNSDGVYLIKLMIDDEETQVLKLVEIQ